MEEALKKFGILFILAGFALGLLYPWAKVNFLGEQITEVQLTNLDFNAQQTATLTLTKADNPVRARFFVKYKRDAYLPPLKIPVIARINDSKGALIAGIISFPTDGHTTGPELGKVRSGNSLDFEVENDGLHQLVMELAPNANAGLVKKPDIANITVKFVANAASKDNPYQIWAIMLGVLGVYLFLRGRRKRKNNSMRKWGRG